MTSRKIKPVQEMSNEDLVAFAEDINMVLNSFHNRILRDDVFLKKIYETEMLGLVYAKDVINELGRRLGYYIEDRAIWLSYDQVNQAKPDNLAEK